MAEPKPETPSPPSLAAVPDPEAPAPRTGPADASSGRGGAPWWLFALVTVLLVASIWGLVGQTRHARAQAREIASLEGQLSEAQTKLTEISGQLTHFVMQRELVNVSVDKLAAQLEQLRALVAWDPTDPTSSVPSASEAPATEAPATGSPAEDTGEAPAAGGEAPATGGELDLDSVPGLRPGPGIELAPRDQV